jgi:hypothetical protein
MMGKYYQDQCHLKVIKSSGERSVLGSVIDFDFDGLLFRRILFIVITSLAFSLPVNLRVVGVIKKSVKDRLNDALLIGGEVRGDKGMNMYW